MVAAVMLFAPVVVAVASVMQLAARSTHRRLSPNRRHTWSIPRAGKSETFGVWIEAFAKPTMRSVAYPFDWCWFRSDVWVALDCSLNAGL